MKITVSRAGRLESMQVMRRWSQAPTWQVHARLEISDWVRRELSGEWLSVAELRQAATRYGLVVERTRK